MIQKIIVTRHEALKDFLVQRGYVTGDTPVLSHASAEDVRGKHVFGVLPLHLAAEAAMVTEVRLNLTPDLRGKELDLGTMERIFGGIFTYKVERLQDPQA